MARLIDADALNAKMYHKSFEVDDGRQVWNSGLWIRYKIFEEAIADAPTVDAVQVVRCKDCKYFLDSSERCGIIDTRLHFYETDKTWTVDNFCSWAERREE